MGGWVPSFDIQQNWLALFFQNTGNSSFLPVEKGSSWRHILCCCCRSRKKRNRGTGTSSLCHAWVCPLEMVKFLILLWTQERQVCMNTHIGSMVFFTYKFVSQDFHNWLFLVATMRTSGQMTEVLEFSSWTNPTRLWPHSSGSYFRVSGCWRADLHLCGLLCFPLPCFS